MKNVIIEPPSDSISASAYKALLLRTHPKLSAFIEEADDNLHRAGEIDYSADQLYNELIASIPKENLVAEYVALKHHAVSRLQSALKTRGRPVNFRFFRFSSGNRANGLI